MRVSGCLVPEVGPQVTTGTFIQARHNKIQEEKDFGNVFPTPSTKAYKGSVGVPPFIFNPLKAELYPICHLLALLGAHHILHVSRVRVNLDIRYRWVVSLTVRPVYFRGKRLPHPLNRRLGAPGRPSVHCEEKKNSFPCRDPNPESSIP